MTTALITGASNGIGLELAKIFASKKTNLVLVARSENKLKSLGQELSDKYNLQCYVYACDLSIPDQANKVYEFCKQNNIQVTYLINNAGFGDYTPFQESKLNMQEEMINLNILTLTKLTHLFLQDMISKRAGGIMNIASTAAFMPGPYMSVYFASKAYVLSFSEALSAELEGTGVNVTAICPGPTQSQFFVNASAENSNMTKGRSMPSAEEVATFAYDRFMRKDAVAIHGVTNKMMATLVRFFPRGLVRKMVRLFMK